MDDEVYATHTHVARVRVIETVKGFYRGFVYLRRIGDDPESAEQHQTEEELAREVQARDAARALARKLLEEHKL
jgi:hypothetical protein